MFLAISSLDGAKATDWITAVGTVGAVAAALCIAITGNKREAELRQQDTARIERQRRADRDVDLLLRAVEANARMKGSSLDTVEIEQASGYLAALPDDIAVLIRINIGNRPDEDPSSSASRKRVWLSGGQTMEFRKVDRTLIAREVALDIRRLASGDTTTTTAVCGQFWWQRADHELTETSPP